MFVRTCQDCGNKQTAKDPKTYSSDSWRDVKCRKCKSMSLDYGSEGYVLVDGVLTKEIKDDEDTQPEI